jgi:adenylylsulfate kinase-like enzyme
MTTVVWITGRAATDKSTLLAACLARLRRAGHDLLRLCDEELLFLLNSPAALVG